MTVLITGPPSRPWCEEPASSSPNVLVRAFSGSWIVEALSDGVLSRLLSHSFSKSTSSARTWSFEKLDFLDWRFSVEIWLSMVEVTQVERIAGVESGG